MRVTRQCEANAISITLMAGGEEIYCPSASRTRTHDSPSATEGEASTVSTTRTVPTTTLNTEGEYLYTIPENLITLLNSCQPLVQAATPAATGDRLPG